jgi:cytochrome c553
MRSARLLAAGVAIAAPTLVFLLAASGAAEAGDVKVGREKAHKCEVCHGLDGLSKIAEAPNIAGQSEQYLIEQLNAFKSGERKNEMMMLVAPTLSSADIEDIAAYYAAIEIAIKKIPGQ